MPEATLTPTQSIDGMYAVLQDKAAADAGFRAELLANPRAAFEKTFGTELPAHVKLSAVEQPADTYVIVVPVAPAVGKDGELSDDDLESVAGGSKSGARKFFESIGNPVVKAGSKVGGAFQKLYNTAPSDWGGARSGDICK